MHLIINNRQEMFPATGLKVLPASLIACTLCVLPASVPLHRAERVDGGLCPEEPARYFPVLLWYLYLIKRFCPHLDVRVTGASNDSLMTTLLTALGLSSATADTPAPAVPLLSRREACILLLLLTGLSVKQVSEQLDRDIRTISTQKRRAMTLLGMKHNADLYRTGVLMYHHHSQPHLPLTLKERSFMAAWMQTGHVTLAADALGVHVRVMSHRRRRVMKKLGVAGDMALFAALTPMYTALSKGRPE
jgi:DNA-binding NarL/FixJ family response regulator